MAAAGKVDASCNVATGEVIPAPFRLSGFLLCNIPIVATMLFTKSVYVQVRAVRTGTGGGWGLGAVLCLNPG